MRYFLIATFLMLVVTKLDAQSPMVFYFDDEWRLTTKESASYYRECTYDTIKQYLDGGVKDFTIDGKLFMVGFYRDKSKEGPFTFFWSNGKVKETGVFEKNVRVGIWKAFYPNGKPRHEVQFTPPGKIIFFDDSTGKRLLSNGTGFWKEEYTDGKVSIINEGNWVNGKPEGDWTSRFRDSTLIYTEKYKKGVFVKGVMHPTKREYNTQFNNHLLIPYSIKTTEDYLQFEASSAVKIGLDSALLDTANVEQVFTVVEEPARPVGGMATFYRQIGELMRYPMEARRKGVEGRVFVEFVVNTDGSLSDVKVIRGIGAGCDDEAIRVIQLSNKWIPGKQRGRSVRTRFNLAIIFKLSNAKFKP